MPETFPTWLLGLLMLAEGAALGVTEALFLAPKYHLTSTNAWRSAVTLVLELVMANIVVYSVVSYMKLSVGRLRPDFFARLATGDEAVIRDGHYSFPSGHSATAMVTGIFWALHLSWTFYFRKPVRGSSSPRPQWRSDLSSFWRLLLIAVGPSLGAAIATSRIYNYRHNASDVNAGAIIGIIGATFWWVRGLATSVLQDPAADHTEFPTIPLDVPVQDVEVASMRS